jgi:DNA-binding transcriptional regulator YdaS (Cro superfamily)
MTVPAVRIDEGGAEAYDPVVALRRAVATLGSNAVAALLGVSKSQPGRWASGREGMSAQSAARVVELDAFLSVLLQAFTPEQAVLWLSGSDPVLGGARPIDAFAVGGLARVLPAVQAHEQGASA